MKGKAFLQIGRGRLYRKILLMMLLIGVLPIILAGLFTLYSVTKSHQASVTSIEENLVNQKIEEVYSFLDGAIAELELIVGLADIDKEFRNSLETQPGLLIGVLNSNTEIEEASFIEASASHPLFGKETSRIVRDEELPNGFVILRRDNPAEAPGLRDARFLPEFIKAFEGGNYRGPVNFTESGAFITISAPVRPNNANEAFSILSARLNLKKIGEIIGRTRLGELGYAYLADSSGRVIASSKTITPIVSNVLVKKIFELKDGNKNFADRYKSYVEYPVAAAGKFMPNSYDEKVSGWALVAEWPTSDSDKILNDLKYQVVAFSIAALLAVILLSLLLANKIVKPIKILESGTERIAKGKFDEPVSIKTGDEIEELGDSFNKMTDGLKQLQALKDEFVFIAAHELKTPVAAIKGYLSLINDGLAGPVNDKVKEFIGKVMNANARLIRLVEDLLEVARSEAGRIKVDVAPTDISPVVNETMSELKPLADEKSMQIIYNPLPDMPKVLADNGRVREVLVNLIGNSIKYTLPRADRDNNIDISHELKGGKLITRIKDRGLGMSKEAQAKLFTKFYRVATKETANISGTGLGLFIVKQIVEKMNGEISVASKEGEGSVFSFSLPIAQKS